MFRTYNRSRRNRVPFQEKRDERRRDQDQPRYENGREVKRPVPAEYHFHL